MTKPWTTRMPRCTGSVLVVAVAVVTIMVAIAYGFLASARLAADSIQAQHFGNFSRIAAQAGIAHACAALDKEFLATPGIPTSFSRSLQFRRGFLPIDSYSEGLATATLTDDEPLGLEFGALDGNESDVKIENGLLEAYTGKTRDEKILALAFAYRGRSQPFKNGTVSHPGGARWIEPGYFHWDLQAHPVSFAPDLVEPSTSVDVNQPLYLDDRLRPVAAFGTEVRYRLRYAIAIEDLSSRLLNGVAGRIDSTTPSVFVTDPVNTVHSQNSMEINPAIARKYVSSFVNLLQASDIEGHWAWSSFLGLGLYPDIKNNAVTRGGSDPASAPVVTASAAGNPVLPVDSPGDPSLRYTNLATPSGSRLAVANRGPWYSFEAFHWPFAKSRFDQEAAFVYTPIGSRGDPSADETRWNHAHADVDTPWRINLLTAPPQVIGAMLYAYMPREAWTYDIISSSHAHIIPSSSTSSAISVTNLFSEAPELSALFGHVSANFDPLQPYPGTVRSGSGEGGPQPCWLRHIGRHITVNEFTGTITSDAIPAPLPTDLAQIMSPLRGQEGGFYKPPMRATIPATDQLWSGQISSLNSNAFYNESYYHDLYTAIGHAIAVAQFAWMGDSGNPADSVTRYPLSWNDPLHPGLAGQPTIDGSNTCSVFRKIKDIDDQFVKNLGEDPRHYPTGSRPSTPLQGLFIDKPRPAGGKYYQGIARLVTHTPLRTIKQLRDSIDLVEEDYDPPAASGPAVTPAKLVQVTNLMELVLNDMRLSFFGASPQYPDFLPIDFNDDGRVYCSGYSAGFNTGSPPPAVDRRFSLTGYFVMQKSRYYRIFCRGELFDLLRSRAVARTDSEMVYCLDPAGALFDLYDQPLWSGVPPALITQTLYQRWLPNRYRGTQSLADPR